VASGSYTDQSGPGYFLARVRPKSSWMDDIAITFYTMSSLINRLFRNATNLDPKANQRDIKPL